MTTRELKVIRAAVRSTRDLIRTLSDGNEMPAEIHDMYYRLNDFAIKLTEMLPEED